MDINKLSINNIILYNGNRAYIKKQLNYNEYLIEIEGELKVINILNIKPLEIKTEEMNLLGFYNKDDVNWTKTIDDTLMNIKVDYDIELSLDELTGILREVPSEYKYIHQIQNLLLYVTNKNNKINYVN